VAQLERCEYVVVGGGVVGETIAWGLARGGVKPLILDAGDCADRASRQNMAQIVHTLTRKPAYPRAGPNAPWAVGQGFDPVEFHLWAYNAAKRWPQYAELLKDETKIDVNLIQNGFFGIHFSQAEGEAACKFLEKISIATAGQSTKFELLDHKETHKRLPNIGPKVATSVFFPKDGQVNVLRVLQALNVALAGRGCEYRANHLVNNIEPVAGGFKITGEWGEVQTEKVILAAGRGNERLAPMVGLSSPLFRSKGQILLTEKCAPIFPNGYATDIVQQDTDGNIRIGNSNVLTTDSNLTDPVGAAAIVQRAVQAFPSLAGLSIIRIWSGFRVLPPDMAPIYEQSTSAPGAFVVTVNGGVCLAPGHLFNLAPAILAGQLGAEYDPFKARRFCVPQTS